MHICFERNNVGLKNLSVQINLYKLQLTENVMWGCQLSFTGCREQLWNQANLVLFDSVFMVDWCEIYSWEVLSDTRRNFSFTEHNGPKIVLWWSLISWWWRILLLMGVKGTYKGVMFCPCTETEGHAWRGAHLSGNGV